MYLFKKVELFCGIAVVSLLSLSSAGEPKKQAKSTRSDVFYDPMVLGVGIAPNSIAVGDFNSDRRRDIAVSCAGDNRVYILRNAGNGQFLKSHVGVPNRPRNLKVARVSKVSDDLVVTTQYFGKRQYWLLKNEGNNKFTAMKLTKRSGTDRMQRVVTGDFNRDGYRDRAVLGRDQKSVTLQFADGKGGFKQSRERLQLQSRPSAIAAADLDGNGKTDLIVANRSAGTVSVFYAK